ncbi:uncharacterized protein N7482_001083 [Penicillium canariense]|uniref:DUF6603 domain-containing protein n=1 Tax=Penicillium canariense TaxID=189055 RepID=A0A9W9LSR5_9EURO|nr:uncharacterized protein N7482_001083 [Penicillium canariense]KAJ5175206.1 hypothetical protein N7482_001083 [Penicillium canariense]
MGGGTLRAAFSCGPLGAHFDAWADFLINYHPFYFQGSVGVSVGVDFTLDLWICSIHISVDIGASLWLQGPPFQGVVHVDFWVFGFDIAFGSGDIPAAPLDWPTFWNLLLQVNEQDPSSSVTSGPDAELVLVVQTGAVPSQGKIQSPEVSPWVVRAGTFSFRVQTRMPLTNAICNGDSTGSLNAKDYTDKDIYSKPMQKSDTFESEMTITIAGVTDSFRLTPVMKQLPVAIWGQYDKETDPSHSSKGNYIPSLMDADAPTVNLMSGVILTAPLPIKGNDTIPTFNAIHANRTDVNVNGDPPLAKTPSIQGSEFVPPSKGPEAGPGTVRTTWAAAGKAEQVEAVEEAASPAYGTVASPRLPSPPSPLDQFVVEWSTLFGWPVNVPILNPKTGDVLQMPLSAEPPTESLLSDLATYESYYVTDPRIAQPITV